MRSNEQLSKCVDVLFAKVQALEAEVSRLKGEGQPEGNGVSGSGPDPDASLEFTFSEPPPLPGAPKSSDSSLENAIGTRWIGRIGVLAILFGVAFFLKYSFDNKLIGEAGRVMLGVLAGAAFIVLGEYFREKRNLVLYGQMLSGGGLALLYLSLYAAFAVYHLIPAPLATLAMLAVTTSGMTLSIRYTAFSLAAIALLGGFLTPIMLSTGKNQPFILFGYVMLLDLGTLLLLRFRHWPSLVPASLLGTFLLYVNWHCRYYTEAEHGLAFGVILIFFVFYNLHILLTQSYSRRPESVADRVVIFGSAAFFFLAFFAQYQWHTVWPVKICSLLLAAAEIGMAGFVCQRRPAAVTTVYTFAAASMVLTVAAIFVCLDKSWVLPVLAAEMALLGWIGLRRNLPGLRGGAYLLGILVLIRFCDDIVFRLEPFERFLPVLNGRFLVCAAAIAAFYVLLNCMVTNAARLGQNEGSMPKVIFVVTQLLSLGLLSVEIHDFFRFRSGGHFLSWSASHYAYQLSLSVFWALYASLLTGAGIFKRLRSARVMGMMILGATVLKVFLVDLSSLQTFYRIISFIVLGLLLLAVSYGYNRFKNLISGEDQP